MESGGPVLSDSLAGGCGPQRPLLPMANTRKLTLRQIIALYDALASLDGHTEVNLDSKGRPQKGKVTPYTVGLKGRYAIIKGLSVLKRFVDDFQKARDALVTEVSGGTGVIARKDSEHPETPDPDYDAKIARMNAELGKLLDGEPEEVAGLVAIPIEDLKLDVNSLLPNSTIVALGDLVTEPVAA